MHTLTIDPRTQSPITTKRGAAELIGVKAARISAWSNPVGRAMPLVHTIEHGGHFTVPLVGIAESAVVAALRKAGLSLARIRAAADYVRDSHGQEFPAASPQLLIDASAELFVEDSEGIYRLKDSQSALREVIDGHLRPLVFAADGIPEAFIVERFKSSKVTLNPRFNAGQMSFEESRIPLFTVLDALNSGDSTYDIAADFNLRVEEVEEVKENRGWLENFA